MNAFERGSHLYRSRRLRGVAIRQGTYELTITERGFHRETHPHRSASSVDAAILRKSAADYPFLAVGVGGALIAFRTEPGESQLWSGVEMQDRPTSCGTAKVQSYYRRSSRRARYRAACPCPWKRWRPLVGDGWVAT